MFLALATFWGLLSSQLSQCFSVKIYLIFWILQRVGLCYLILCHRISICTLGESPLAQLEPVNAEKDSSTMNLAFLMLHGDHPSRSSEEHLCLAIRHWTAQSFTLLTLRIVKKRLLFAIIFLVLVPASSSISYHSLEVIATCTPTINPIIALSSDFITSVCYKVVFLFQRWFPSSFLPPGSSIS